MDLLVEDTLPWPREQVFVTRRDRLPALVGDMQNVDAIRVKSEGRSASGVVDLETVWVGAYAHVPMAMRGSIPPDALSWTEQGRFDPKSWCHHWKITVYALREAIHAEGTDTFETTQDGGTRITVRGSFAIDMAKVPLPPGVPAFLLGSVAGKVENFFLGMVQESMHQTHRSIDKFLAAQS